MAWFFQKGLGSRLLLNALSRCCVSSDVNGGKLLCVSLLSSLAAIGLISKSVKRHWTWQESESIRVPGGMQLLKPSFGLSCPETYTDRTQSLRPQTSAPEKALDAFRPFRYASQWWRVLKCEGRWERLKLNYASKEVKRPRRKDNARWDKDSFSMVGTFSYQVDQFDQFRTIFAPHISSVATLPNTTSWKGMSW